MVAKASDVIKIIDKNINNYNADKYTINQSVTNENKQRESPKREREREKEIHSNVSYWKAEEVLCPFVILLSEILIF